MILYTCTHYTVKNLQDESYFTNFVFASDHGSSWRKTIFPEYKANRKEKRDETLDWKFIYQMYEEFKEELERDTSVKVLQQKGRVCDDLCRSGKAPRF